MLYILALLIATIVQHKGINILIGYLAEAARCIFILLAIIITGNTIHYLNTVQYGACVTM